MRLDALTVQPYRLPLRCPWQSARGSLGERLGWLVTAESDGLCGYGDCAPLSEAGTESGSAAIRSLRHWQERLSGLGIGSALSLLAAAPHEAPAARYALESALLDLQSRHARRPLRHWIGGAGATPDWIPVNGVLGPGATVSDETLRRAIASGFRVLKVKVGCAEPEAEIGRLADLASGLPAGVGLRLDANGAWSQVTAERVITALNALPVESLEEPLDRPDPASLLRLQALATFPLALDESLAHWIPGLERRGLPVRRAIIKPAVVGGVTASLRLAERLHAAGIEVVVTGVVDSAAGLWATAQVAAAVGSTIPHGLATWDWLAMDLGRPPIPRAGRLLLPEAPGSGFNPDGPGTTSG
jgi:o-succinylbenzoate synthase